MKKVFFTAVLSLLLVVPKQAEAQYQPDTMDFASFLNMCQDFSRSNRQELWVVTFWASWNSTSLYQLPALKASYYNYQHKPVRFFYLSRDRSSEIWKATMEREQIPGTNVLVSQPEDYEYLKQGFQHSSLPAMFLVDSGGNIYRVDRVQQLREMLEEQSRTLPDNFVSNQPGTVPTPAPGGTGNPFNVDTEPPVSQPSTPGASGQAGGTSNDYLTHTVRPSETLYRISKQYDVSIESIRALNNFSGNLIKVGQELKIKRN